MGSRLLPSPVIRIAFTRGNINKKEREYQIILLLIETLTPHPHGVVGATAVRFSVAGRQALLNVKRRRAWYATHNRHRHTQNEKHLRKQPGTKLKKEKKVSEFKRTDITDGYSNYRWIQELQNCYRYYISCSHVPPKPAYSYVYRRMGPRGLTKAS